MFNCLGHVISIYPSIIFNKNDWFSAYTKVGMFFEKEKILNGFQKII